VKLRCFWTTRIPQVIQQKPSQHKHLLQVSNSPRAPLMRLIWNWSTHGPVAMPCYNHCNLSQAAGYNLCELPPYLMERELLLRTNRFGAFGMPCWTDLIHSESHSECTESLLHRSGISCIGCSCCMLYRLTWIDWQLVSRRGTPIWMHTLLLALSAIAAIKLPSQCPYVEGGFNGRLCWAFCVRNNSLWTCALRLPLKSRARQFIYS
jgi:hypothetical protein